MINTMGTLYVLKHASFKIYSFFLEFQISYVNLILFLFKYFQQDLTETVSPGTRVPIRYVQKKNISRNSKRVI